jgi:hypothetical protein
MSGRDPLSGVTPVDANGNPYPLATIDYYIVGTTTREDTYTTAALSVANSNPITLGADGRIPEIFFSQTRMKRVFKDSSGNTISGLSWDGIDKDLGRVKAASAPSPTYPGLEWHDTSTGDLKERNAANTDWINRGPVDSVGNTASVTETLTGTATDKLVTPDSLAALWQRGTNLTPSAGTVSLPSTGGGAYNVAAGNFSAISTAQGGREVEFTFGGVSVITHNATSLDLPGAANITTVAGDIAKFRNKAAADASGTNWECTVYTRNSGSPLNITDQLGSQSDAETGTSTTKTLPISLMKNLALMPKAWVNFNGSGTLAINSDAGVSSVTDNGTGDYTVNFDTAFSASTAYNAVGFARYSTTGIAGLISAQSGDSKTTTAFQIGTANSTSAVRVDSPEVGMGFLGDQ